MSTSSDHWYHHGPVWLVVSIPFTAVVFGVLMFVMAAKTPSDLVVDDYYKEGKGINQRLQLDRRAGELGVSVELANVSEAGLTLTSGADTRFIEMNLYHVASQEKDLTAGFSHTSNGIFLLEEGAPNPGPLLATKGVWYVELIDRENGWRLRQRVETPINAMTLEAGS